MTWKKLSSKKIFESRFFDLSEDICETSSGLVVPRYFMLSFPDWVQAVALDEQGQLILVNQYRYPGQKNFLEFPGGSTSFDRQEDPLVAAQRELLEETGYQSNEWQYLGAHYPNPALQSNRVHSFLALNCKKVADLNLDPFEELSVELYSLNDFLQLCTQKDGQHSLMLATLFLAQHKMTGQ